MADDKKEEANKDQVSEEANLPTQKIPSGKMHVKVYAPFKTYFNGVADSLTAVNPTGPFDILPRHKNFMTLMSPCEIIVRNDGKEDKVKITRGIMHVKENEIIVFLDV
ncbi:MAG: hypothetical protein M3Q79_04795 [bacterium]|nr:hypothetical protein [bacterium]